MQEIITKIIIGAAAAWAIYRIFKWFGRRRKSQCGCGACGCGGMRRMRAAFGLQKKKSNRMRSLIINGSPRRNGTIGTDDASRFGNSRAGRRAGPYRRLPGSLPARLACDAAKRASARCRTTTDTIWPSKTVMRICSVIGSPTHWGGHERAAEKLVRPERSRLHGRKRPGHSRSPVRKGSEP